MAIDLLTIQPHKVSRSLKGYSVFFYGEPKSGKTTTAVRFPDSLLLAFEKGYNAIPGVRAQPIEKWSDFKSVLRQLRKDELKEVYQTIVVDTVDIAYGLCEKYICAQNGVSVLSEIPYGKGYQLVEKEFDECLRQIVQLDYGLVMISHSQDKVFKDEEGEEYNQIIPTMDKRGNKIVTRMADIIGYSRTVETEESSETRLYMRGTQRFVAGSRFPDTPDYIVFSYQNLVNAIHDAVEKLEEQYGAESITDENSNLYILDNSTGDVEVEELIEQFQELAGSLAEQDEKYFIPRIQTIVRNVLGEGKKIIDATPDQVDLVQVALEELQDVADKKNGK